MDWEARRWLFNEKVIALAPRVRGVYVLWRGDKVVYVGCARDGSNVRECLQRHAADVNLAPAPSHFSWIASNDPQTLEAQLLAYVAFAQGYRPARSAASGTAPRR